MSTALEEQVRILEAKVKNLDERLVATRKIVDSISELGAKQAEHIHEALICILSMLRHSDPKIEAAMRVAAETSEQAKMILEATE